MPVRWAGGLGRGGAHQIPAHSGGADFVSYQKTGIVRYNAFKGMGGNLSFVLALLDDNNSGFILNSVHSREGCYLYLKDVDKGQTDTILGSEEKEALEQALGY